MAAISSDSYGYAGANRFIEKCRVVSVDLTDLTDADTYVAGPGLLTYAWEQGTTNLGVGNWLITSRATGTLEWDSAAAAQAGTLWLFYGGM